MPRGRTSSALTLSERREQAFDYFQRGWKHADIARKLRVTPDTVTRYKREYEATIQQQAEENPRLLTNLVENTVRALVELDQVRRAAWSEYDKAKDKPAIRAQLLRQLTQISHERSALFGLFGVKQEYFAHVQRVQQFQDALLDWMRSNLCADDRRKLEAFIRQQTMAGPTPTVDLDVPALPA